MKEPRVRIYQYVNRSYGAVRELFRLQAQELFQRATTSAAARASALAANLHASLGGVDVGVDVRIHVQSVRDEVGVAGMSPVTHVALAWEALRAPALFPVMNAQLSVWPLTASETQLEIEGAYRPPLGVAGSVIDAAVGHRVAEAAIHRFLDDVVEQLRRELPEGKS